MILAEVQPNPESLSQFWLVAGLLASFGCNVVVIIVSIITVSSNKKQRREVTFGFEPVSKSDFDEARIVRDQELRAIRAEVKENRENAERERRITAAGIYKKLDETRAELENKVDEVKETMRTLPSEVIVVLRNTGVIK